MTDFVAAECGIRQLHARFVDAVSRKDAKSFAECFAADGEWKIAGTHMRERDNIGNMFGKLLDICAHVQIIMGTPVIDVENGAAFGRVQVTELAKMSDGSSAMTFGVYYDRYVQENGRWCFKWRHFSLKYRGPIDLSADLVPSPDYGPHPAMPADDEPTLTRRAPVE